jgi:hypothetical protein
MVIFYNEELLAPRPTPKLEDHPLSAVRDWLFNVFAATLHIRRPFLHPQPEDAPCRGDRDPLITDNFKTLGLIQQMYIGQIYILFSKEVKILPPADVAGCLKFFKTYFR